MRFAREITAAVAAPIAIWIIGWGHPYVFDAAIALISVLAMFEFLSLGKSKGYEMPFALCIVLMLVIMAAFVLPNLSVEFGMFAVLLIIPASYVLGRRT